jgi:cyclic pyranopterin monophosphate synthase
MSDSSHFDEAGHSRMVDIGSKPITERMARAAGEVRMLESTLERIRRRDFSKGDVLEVARLAGIMGAKRTPDLIPLCHPLPLDSVTVDFSFSDATTLGIKAQVRTTARTGVEMEALTAVCVAALTVYDMCKSVDRGMQIGAVRLEEKSGGCSGNFVRGQGSGARGQDEAG